MSRRLIAVLAAVVAVVGLTGCGERDERTDEVRRYIRNTRSDIGKFAYLSEQPANPIANQPELTIGVQGLVEDDFRFKAKVLGNEEEVFEQVVYDDALAVRFLQPEFMSLLLDKNRAAGADLTTDVEGMTVLDALRTRRWVFDPTGAPALTRGTVDVDDIGDDPVFDALTALDYVEQAVIESAGVQLWDEDALNPTYLRSEDTFPKPDSDSGVKRFDLIRPSQPIPGSRGGTGEVNLPSTRHFRRMAIYVKDERILRVIEHVDIRGNKLERFPGYMRSILEESEAPQEAFEGLRELEEQFSDEVAATAWLQVLNFALQSFGAERVLVRNMTLDFLEEEGEVEVALPAAEVVRGDLGILTISDEAKDTQDTAGNAEPEAGVGEPVAPGGETGDGGAGAGDAGDGSSDGPGGDPPPPAPPPSP